MTIEGLAAAAGIHPTYLSGIERGRFNPSWEKLGALASGLDCPLSDIVLDAERGAAGPTS
jgi:transcriptional regulator with XRE-family HTH domain